MFPQDMSFEISKFISTSAITLNFKVFWMKVRNDWDIVKYAKKFNQKTKNTENLKKKLKRNQKITELFKIK